MSPPPDNLISKPTIALDLMRTPQRHIELGSSKHRVLADNAIALSNGTPTYI